MKKLLTFLLLSISSYSFAQVSVVNADSVRLGNPAGSGSVSLYGKTYLKNITEGGSEDNVLVRGADGQIRYIKQGSSASAVAGIPFSDSDNLSAISNPGKLIYNTTLQKLRIYDSITSTWKDASPADLGNFYTKSEIDGLIGNVQVPGLQAVTDKNNTTTKRIYALGGLTTNGYNVTGDVLGYNTMSSAKQLYTQSPDGTRFTWIDTHPSPNVGDVSTNYAINWRRKSGTVAFLEDISGTQTPTLQDVTTAGNTTTTGATFGGNVGVGTTTPAEKLSVIGKATVSDAPTNPTDVVRKQELDTKENALTFGNYFSRAGNNISLGGGHSNGSVFFESYNPANYLSITMDPGSGVRTLSTRSIVPSDNAISFVGLSGPTSAPTVKISAYNGTSERSIRLSNQPDEFSKITVTDAIGSKGLYSAADYTGNWTFPADNNVFATAKYVNDKVANLSTTNNTTTAFTNATLNSTYPTAPIRYEVWCPAVNGGAGALYKKVDTSQWIIVSMTKL